MPHLILDVSAGLEQTYDLNAVCKSVFDALITDPSIPDPKALKVRVNIQRYSYLGTDAQTYVHGTLLFLAGRDDATQARLTKLVLEELRIHMPTALNYSVNAQDMNPDIYTKVAQS
jgi:5-carboxymethyl-2-hydroxymuconate isomerase